MTVPLPANGDTSWDDWAAYVDGRVAGNGAAGTPTTRSIGTGSLEAAAGSHTHSTTAASETVAGIVELSDGTETPAGTDATRAVSPLRLAAELAKKQNLLTTTTTQAGTTYTLAIGDAGTQVKATSATAVTVTVPPNSSVAFTVGSSLLVRQDGAGQVTIAPGAGVTLKARGGALKTAGQYAGLTLTKDATDTWYVEGDATT